MTAACIVSLLYGKLEQALKLTDLGAVDENVLLGSTFNNPSIRWAKTVAIDSLDTSTVHGHVFVVTDNGLLPYELEDGALPDLSSVDEGFLSEFISYIIKHKLQSLLGLQVLGCGESPMIELILDQGTVMLESSQSHGVQSTRITGWRFESVDGRPRVCAANETHSKMTSGSHKVFNAGKPLPKLENVEDLKNALLDVGVLKTG
ncbi:hypothetical protein CBER1_11654 [Cercospora berteroae]|uniref:Uncharacterized protein n=1 Tax=Cercospora berteroae TaxID=357750 RepID=A0A2S6BZN8_9PEZI|nr:hypothetical protein CBER1_11654 [Cercospora berteroae]